MPKKHRPQFTKLEGTSSSSTSSPTRRTTGGASDSPQQSVNDLLRHLRRSQNAGTAEQRARERELAAVATAPTVHPSLRELLHIPEIPAPRSRRPPRRHGLFRDRGPAGPPPPLSWLTESIHAPAQIQEMDRRRTISRARPRHVDRLPGMRLPRDSRSLIHQCLRALATNWEWHVVYDQYYLATLPAGLKSALLSYIGVYGSDNGVGIDGLRILFLNPGELEDATPAAETTHLDLTGAVGRSIGMKQLGQYLFPPVPAPGPATGSSTSAATATTATTAMGTSSSSETSQPAPAAPAILEESTSSPPPFPEITELSDVLESWEDEADAEEQVNAKSNFIPQPLSFNNTRFPHLTHLSLSHPGPGASWSRLLSLSSHLATLTHLSLAYWPPPSLTPNSRTATAVSKFSPAVSYGGTTIYSAFEGDWLEAASILRRLSRATYCLRWLDLEGCTSWLGALKWDVDGHGIEWNAAWRRVEYVNLSQGWLPKSYEKEMMGSEHHSLVTSTTTTVPPIETAQIDRSPRATGRTGTSDETTPVNDLDGSDSWDDGLSEERDVSDWLTNARLILAVAGAIRQRRALGKGSGKVPITVDCGWRGWWIDKEVIGH
ncbi:hypothetical protein L228DRAFT_158667 [Xylona heveae TC161]|uniref:Tafazzin n=1 Tax=Xylona heveae (strain CBS 132557 / TC161) TaxID=1328760 RepID=A0A165G4H1_XYLHT|nr:hypothetical protein L228DRAFT_158667 [Xylona heveae TC161]KZF21728.1 hypothetical protein L228DRAFT_158667 [Xylona heveae TC161]